MDDESPPQVGFLVPLNDKFEEDASKPYIPIFQGPNIVGRNCVPVADKRLSRKHLTVTASGDGTADVVVDGTNPVVVRSHAQRKKILSQERERINHGDIIELIPGHYLFKYLTLATEKTSSSPNKEKRTLEESSKLCEGEVQCVKRKRQVSDDEALARRLQSELYDDSLARNNSLEAIRHFNVSTEKLASTFRLLRVKGLPTWANTSTVSIGDVIEGNPLIAVLSNYMVDIDWLISACPTLKRVPHVLVIHGESGGTLEHMKLFLENQASKLDST